MAGSNFDNNFNSTNPNDTNVYPPDQGRSNVPSYAQNNNQNNFNNQGYFDPNNSVNYDPNYNPNFANQNQPVVQNYPTGQAGYSNQYYQNQPVNQNFDSYGPSNSYNPNFDNQINNEPPSPTNTNGKMEKIKAFLILKWWIVLLVLLAFILLAVGIYVAIGGSSGGSNTLNGIMNNSSQTKNADKLKTEIKAPSTLAQGTPGDWEILIENTTNLPIVNIELNLSFDRTFQFLREYSPSAENSEGTIYKIARLDAAGGRTPSVKVRFQGFLNGNVDLESEMGGTLIFAQENSPGSNSQNFNQELIRARTKITSPQIDITLLPSKEQVQNNGEVEMTVKIKNNTDNEIRDLRLRMVYPATQNSFIYSSSEYIRDGATPVQKTPDNGDNIWLIPRLPAGGEQTLKVRGKVNGANNIKLTFGAEIGLKAKNNDYQVIWQGYKDVTVVSQPLSITTSFETKDNLKVFRPSEELTMLVEYQNQGQSTLNNVQIYGFIDDPVGLLDLSTISFEGGERGDISGNEIVWRSPRTPQLASVRPQQKGQFKVKIKTKEKDKFINTTLDQTQYTLRPGTRAKADNLETITNVSDLYKAKGELEFLQSKAVKKGRNDKTNKDIYAITWTLKSTQNELKDVYVKAISPLVGTWRQDSISPKSMEKTLSYNERNGEIIWNIDKLKAYSGLTNPEISISFELEIPPSDNNDVLIFAPTAFATDNFTDEKFEIKKEQVATKGF